MKHSGLKFFALASVLSLAAPQAFAAEPIIRPYQSVRSSGMGGVRITTGLYDENFFGNPARVTANPTWRITLFDPMVEANSSSITNVSNLVSKGATLSNIADTVGTNNHLRLQTTMPAFYLPTTEDRPWALGVALITSSQLDFDLRRSYQVKPQAIIDLGPAVTYGRQFLENKSLSIGTTAHLTYRAAMDSSYSLTDFIRGRSLAPSQTGNDGAMVDVDLGSTFQFPFHLGPWNVIGGASINNVLGGGYTNTGIHVLKAGKNPPVQPRTYNAGMSVQRDSVGILGKTVLAFEITDVGNNPDGSLFRTVHLGGETRFGILLPRVGINQGYLAAGLGIDLKLLTLDFATYGEEISLNVGGREDRRYAFRLALQL